MSDPAAEAAAVASLEHIVKVAQIYVASTTSVLVWDWLACLPQEWKYIWKASWSPIKVLYILVRYYTLVVLVVTDVWFFASWSEEACAKNLRILPGVAVLIDLSIECVLALRVYALFGGTQRVAAVLLVLLAAFLGVIVAVPILAFDYTRLPSWPGPCLVTGKRSSAGPKFIIAFYAAPMAFDAIMTGLTLFKAIKYKHQGSSSSLINLFIRDGTFYFCAITSLNLINVIFFVQPNPLIQAINAPMSIQLSSVLCSRLILNLRAERDRKPAVKQFSKTRGRWITDLPVHESTEPELVLSAVKSPLSSRVHTASIKEDHSSPPVSNGIVVRWEQEVNYDTWDGKPKNDDGKSTTDSAQ